MASASSTPEEPWWNVSWRPEKHFMSTGCVVAFQDSVNFDIQQVGGIKSSLFGGEGLFYAVLQGPARSGCNPFLLAPGGQDVGGGPPQKGGSQGEGSILGETGQPDRWRLVRLSPGRIGTLARQQQRRVGKCPSYYSQPWADRAVIHQATSGRIRTQSLSANPLPQTRELCFGGTDTDDRASDPAYLAHNPSERAI